MATDGMTAASTSHVVVRFDIAIREEYEEFRRRFEAAVPVFDRDRVRSLIERGAKWPDIVADAAAATRYEFLLYWKLDLTPLISLAGNAQRATEYLLGNHVIAETMYRHDPAVGLYVPLRCLIYERDEGTRLGIEQPSSVLSGLGSEAISQVGLDLDRKLATLLTALDAAVPAALAPRALSR
ncbi:MAG: DUF302 domain-containing protein [Steroidobacteraceae bacterium]